MADEVNITDIPVQSPTPAPDVTEPLPPIEVELILPDEAINVTAKLSHNAIDALASITKQDIFDVILQYSAQNDGWIYNHQVLITGLCALVAAIIAYYAPKALERQKRKSIAEEKERVWISKKHFIITDMTNNIYNAVSYTKDAVDHIEYINKFHSSEPQLSIQMPDKDKIFTALDGANLKGALFPLEEENIQYLTENERRFFTLTKFRTEYIKLLVEKMYQRWERHLHLMKLCNAAGESPWGDNDVVFNWGHVNANAKAAFAATRELSNHVDEFSHKFTPEIGKEMAAAKEKAEGMDKETEIKNVRQGT